MRTMKAAIAAATVAMATLPALAQDPNLARNLAATCANCHGTDGNATDANATLAGMSATKLIGLLNDFKSGKKPATVMHQLSKGYTDEQLRLIAAYFASRK